MGLTDFHPKAVVLISANAEWEAIRLLFPGVAFMQSPFGEWFVQDAPYPVIFFQGGWGKISAAASAQYVIDQWKPGLLVNLGTCGGFKGKIERGEVILVDQTAVYDIIEQMVDDAPFLSFYATQIDLSWLKEPYPMEVRRTSLVSGDRDLLVDEIATLEERFGAVAGDWESGAIAWVAARNRTRLLILRAVSDLVGSEGGEAYGDYERFKQAAREIMARLVDALPLWLEHVG
jgi:adenosylhomocysteine nucleosidase